MKKILLSLSLSVSLLMVSAAAHADWVRVEHSAQDLALYMDPETLKAENGTTKLWHLVDYQTVQQIDGKDFRSFKAQDEYDCAKGVRRELLYLWHAEPMGNSRMVQALYVPSAWTKPEQGSLNQTLMQKVCSRP
jgi:uncharacterized GH25 family protein